MIKVGVSGAAGRMGRSIITLLQQDAQEFVLVCALERAGHPDLGSDAGVVVGIGGIGVPIVDSISQKPDVLLDFSSPEGAVAHATECAVLGTAIVVGTTGLTESQIEHIRREAATKIPVLVSPNMSVGVNVLLKLVGQTAAALGEDYDIEIIETHHRRKKDAPSGTALGLAKAICDALSWPMKEVIALGRQGIGERPRRQLAIHAVRGGDVVGDHTVIFAGEGERIEITHRASSRDVFARGAIRAARLLADRPAGMYTMKDLLF